MTRTATSLQLVIGLVTCGLALGASRTAAAHEGPGGNLGVGVGIGIPTALSVEVAPTPFSGIEGAIGFATFDGNAYGHLVFKHNMVDLAHGPTVVLPLYLGLGGFMLDRDPGAPDLVELGARAPLGVNLDFQRAPIQAFGEVALNLTLVEIDHERSDRLDLGGYVGMRYWF